ncbi:MAG: DNA-binding protein [Bacteroidota bacterium]
MEKKVFTVKTGAEYYGVSESYMQKLKHFRKVPFSKPNGKLTFFKKEDLDNYFLGNRIEAVPKVDLEEEAANYLLKNAVSA